VRAGIRGLGAGVGVCSAIVFAGGALVPAAGFAHRSAIAAAPRRPSFAAPRRIPVAAHPDAVAIGDLNGDRRPDLAVASTNTTGPPGTETSSVSVLLGRGDGSFGAASRYPTGVVADSIAIGDLNGDGKPELAVANWGEDTVTVYVNRGAGRFKAGFALATGKDPSDVTIGDLDGDGSAELVVASTTIDRGGAQSLVSVFANNGDATFQDRIDYRPRRGSYAVAIGDLNRDRKPDLVSANRSDSISVFFNNGDGTFRPRVDARAGSGPRSLAIGDLDGDRKPDVVTANTSTASFSGDRDSVSVLRNRGDGSFRPKLDYRTHGNLLFDSVAIGDLNGDRKQDVAIGTDDTTVSVLVNRGDGKFVRRIEYRIGPGGYGGDTRSIAIGDLNRDGRLDIASVNLASVSVLLNTTRR
jgi:hypothetical protein